MVCRCASSARYPEADRDGAPHEPSHWSSHLPLPTLSVPLVLSSDSKVFHIIASHFVTSTGLKPKPLRAHHCRTCNRCVLKQDHHCPWINGCVGFGNQRFFYLFLVYLTIGCFFVVVRVSFRSIQELRLSRSLHLLLGIVLPDPPSQAIGLPYFWIGESSRSERSVIIFCILLAGVAGVALGRMDFRPREKSKPSFISFPGSPFLFCFCFTSAGGFTGFHTHLLLTNQTTIEFQANRRRRRILGVGPKDKEEPIKINPFDLGWKWNFESVFGPSPRRLEKRLRLLLQKEQAEIPVLKPELRIEEGATKEAWDDVLLSGGVWLHWLVPFRGLWDPTRKFYPTPQHRLYGRDREDDAWSGQGFRGGILIVLGLFGSAGEALLQGFRKWCIGDEDWMSLGENGHEWWVTLEDVNSDAYTAPYRGRRLTSLNLDAEGLEQVTEAESSRGDSLHQRVAWADRTSKNLHWEKIGWNDWREDVHELMLEEERFFAEGIQRLPL